MGAGISIHWLGEPQVLVIEKLRVEWRDQPGTGGGWHCSVFTQKPVLFPPYGLLKLSLPGTTEHILH